MTISLEAIGIARSVTSGWMNPERDAAYRDAQKAAQLAINSATAPLQKEIDKWKASHDNQVKLRRMLMDRPDLKERAKLVSGLTEENQKLQKEIERLRGEVEKAWREGFKDGQFGFVPSIVTEVRRDYVWQESRARRVAEGKE